jgi:hypothetical protein
MANGRPGRKKKDMTGRTYGCFRAIRPTRQRIQASVVWEVQCVICNRKMFRSQVTLAYHRAACPCQKNAQTEKIRKMRETMTVIEIAALLDTTTQGIYYHLNREKDKETRRDKRRASGIKGKAPAGRDCRGFPIVPGREAAVA